MGKQIIPPEFKKKQNKIPIDYWTKSVEYYISCNGDATSAYARLKNDGIDYGYRKFLDFVHNGDQIRNLPPIQSLYIEQLQKVVSSTKASITERLKETLDITDKYKEALSKKIDLLVADPAKVTRNIGAEIRHLSEIEHAAAKLFNDNEQASVKEAMSLEKARELRSKSMAHLASKATMDESDEDESDLAKALRIVK